ncbi:MAG: hypothetical protein Q7S21_06805 [archaeon]|nr:hypothetical protein [archaeon]
MNLLKVLLIFVGVLVLLAVFIPFWAEPWPNPNSFLPIDEAITQIKNLYNKPGQHVLTKQVTFREGGALSAKAIANGSQLLSEEQVWLGLGGFENSKDFSYYDNGKRIAYSGSAIRVAKLSILCDEGSKIENDLIENNIPIPTAPNPMCTDSNNPMCCAVVLRSA